MVVVTIDSNVSRIPRMVAEHLFRPARAWCRSIGDCDKRKSPADVVYYDTPLALDRLSEYPDDMFSGFLNFVYLDLSEKNASTDRLIENMAHRGENDQRLVLILNNGNDPSSPSPKRTAKVVYALKTINCSDGIVSEAIAALINSFLYEGRLLHPVDVISLSCGKAVRKFRRLDDNEMPFDVQQLIRCRNISKPFENDCVDCHRNVAAATPNAKK